MAKEPLLSVVVPSWNSSSELRANLPHVIEAARLVSAEIIVVDDASTLDDSLAYLSSLGNAIKLYKNSKNLGFSRTVNLGVTHARGKIVVLLNTDVSPALDCFAKIIPYFDNQNVYALALNSQEGWMRGTWDRGLLHHFCSRSKVATTSPVYSLWASGGQGAFSRAKWIALGGMDPLYAPFYWEDVDMGYSAWKRGWQILYAADCRVTHHHQNSSIGTHFSSASIKQVAQRNQFLFVWKNISDLRLLLDYARYLPYYIWQYPAVMIQVLLRLPQAIISRHRARRYWKRRDQDILSLWPN